MLSSLLFFSPQRNAKLIVSSLWVFRIVRLRCRRLCLPSRPRSFAYGHVRNGQGRGGSKASGGRRTSEEEREGEGHLGRSHFVQGCDARQVPTVVEPRRSDRCYPQGRWSFEVRLLHPFSLSLFVPLTFSSFSLFLSQSRERRRTFLHPSSQRPSLRRTQPERTFHPHRSLYPYRRLLYYPPTTASFPSCHPHWIRLRSPHRSQSARPPQPRSQPFPPSRSCSVLLSTRSSFGYPHWSSSEHSSFEVGCVGG